MPTFEELKSKVYGYIENNSGSKANITVLTFDKIYAAQKQTYPLVTEKEVERAISRLVQKEEITKVAIPHYLPPNKLRDFGIIGYKVESLSLLITIVSWWILGSYILGSVITRINFTGENATLGWIVAIYHSIIVLSAVLISYFFIKQVVNWAEEKTPQIVDAVTNREVWLFLACILIIQFLVWTYILGTGTRPLSGVEFAATFGVGIAFWWVARKIFVEKEEWGKRSKTHNH